MNRILDTTLGGLLDDMAARHPDGEALADLGAGRRLTWAGFAMETDRLAKGLMAMGVESGAHLAVWGGTSIEWVLTQYASAKIGAVLVSADPEYDADPMAYLLEQSDADTLVVIAGYKDRDFAETMRSICPEIGAGAERGLGSERLPRLKRLVKAGGGPQPGFMSWENLLETGRAVSDGELARRKAGVKPGDVTLLAYTSGTTGAPKGVMCTHRGLIDKSRRAADIQNMDADDRTGFLVPISHMFGNTCALLTAMTVGSATVLFGPSFDTRQALRGLAESRCTILYGAPSQFIAIMEHPEYKKADVSTLRGGIMGGAPCPMEVMKRVVHDMGVGGILVGYGQTEASSWVTLTRPDDPLDLRVSTIGRALPDTEVKIIDPRTGQDLPPGEPGELCTRGFLMAGYYKMPAATAGAVDQDGWLHTGDLVAMDKAGNCRVMGRIKDLISGGEGEISPVEIEEVLFAHPDVVEAAAFGLPADGGRERVAVWLKVKPGARLGLEDVAGYCRDRLPSHMVPAFVHLADSFPMTATGKVQKFKMREMTEAMLKESQ